MTLMNYEEIYSKWETLPQCRIRVDLGDGGENCWGRELPDGTFALDNYPLHGELLWQDVVSTKNVTSVEQRVHQRWKTRIFFPYPSDEDDDVDAATRESILSTLRANKLEGGFWSKGTAYATFAEEISPIDAAGKIIEMMMKKGIEIPSYDEEE